MTDDDYCTTEWAARTECTEHDDHHLCDRPTSHPGDHVCYCGDTRSAELTPAPDRCPIDLVPADAGHYARVTIAEMTGSTPEDLAELCYVRLELGDTPGAWRRFWRELFRIGVTPDLDFLAEVGFDTKAVAR